MLDKETQEGPEGKWGCLVFAALMLAVALAIIEEILKPM